jgi:hypothetical protein
VDAILGTHRSLLEVMAPDVVLIADGGGLAAAALAPVHGAELVARVLARASRSALTSTTVWLNGAPAGRLEVDGEPATVSLVVEDGRVTRVYLVPKKRRVPAPLHFQHIAHRGACRKTPVVPHNRRPGSEFMEWVIRRCVCCCRRMTRAGEEGTR